MTRSSRKRHRPEAVVTKLRQADEVLAKGTPHAEMWRSTEFGVRVKFVERLSPAWFVDFRYHFNMRGKYFYSLVLHSALIMLWGCSTDEAGRYYPVEKYPARPASEVEILTKAPQRDYVVIADIQAHNVSPEHMQRRAGEIGGDAVILVRGGGNYSKDEVWASVDRYGTSYSRLLATVIKFK